MEDEADQELLMARLPTPPPPRSAFAQEADDVVVGNSLYRIRSPTATHSATRSAAICVANAARVAQTHLAADMAAQEHRHWLARLRLRQYSEALAERVFRHYCEHRGDSAMAHANATTLLETVTRDRGERVLDDERLLRYVCKNPTMVLLLFVARSLAVQREWSDTHAHVRASHMAQMLADPLVAMPCCDTRVSSDMRLRYAIDLLLDDLSRSTAAGCRSGTAESGADNGLPHYTLQTMWAGRMARMGTTLRQHVHETLAAL